MPVILGKCIPSLNICFIVLEVAELKRKDWLLGMLFRHIIHDFQRINLLISETFFWRRGDNIRVGDYK